EEFIGAGANFFGLYGEQSDWLIEQPVFFHGQAAFPDSFYRSNWFTTQMFIDEPSVRLGWGGGFSNNPSGPEQVAEALRQRVASQLTIADRTMKVSQAISLGTLDLISPNFMSWDTDYWSAWYELSAGASAIVHEGRYESHNYGWHPRDLFGQEGL